MEQHMKGLFYCLFDTQLGVCGIIWKDSEKAEGLPVVTSLQFPEATEKLTEERIAGKAGGCRVGSPPSRIAEIIQKIRTHLNGKAQDFRDIAIGLAGIGPFAQQVYTACRNIPAGRTLSYGQLAGAIHHPGAARAVGQALARNPIPLIIPCHRVLTFDGRAGGFSAPGGVATKARILAIEGVTIKGKKERDE
jgi:O-6-methylguanine DNA methyltransferase